MTDDTARALGAGGRSFNINGKVCKARPLSLKELAELGRVCLRAYKKDQIQGYKQMLEDCGLPSTEINSMLMTKVQELSAIELEDLPTKTAYNPPELTITPDLKNWMVQNLGVEDKETDLQFQIKAAAALSGGLLSEADYEKLVGKKPRRVLQPYVAWWCSEQPAGVIAMLYQAFQSYGVTEDEVIEAFRKDEEGLRDMHREVEILSAPQPGNG